MAEYTQNYNLYKPNRTDTDPVDTTLSANFQTIDDEIKKRETDISTVSTDLITKTDDLQVQIDTKTFTLQEQVNNMVIESGTSDAEVLQARGSYPVLNERMNAQQNYKLTQNDGNRTYLTETGIDLLTLGSGFYESTGDRLLNTPWDDSGFVEIDVYQNTTGSGTRKQFVLNYSYSKRVFIGNLHTGGAFQGWVEVAHNKDVSPYLENELSGLYEKVASLQSQTTKSIGFITDTHYIKNSIGVYGFNAIKHVRNIADFSNYGLLDMVIHGGDIINGKTDPARYKSELYEMLKEISAVKCPKAVLKGNHDYGGWYNANIANPLLTNELSPLEWFNRFTKPFISDFISDSANPTGSYFYKDYDDIKLRVICLNTADIPYLANADGSPKYPSIDKHALRNEQLNWLANKALNFSSKTSPSGWAVVTFSHVPFYNPDSVKVVENGEVANGILKAFKTGTSYTSTTTSGDFGQSVTVDFTGKSGFHVGHITGHYHLDRNYLIDTVRYITCLHSATADASSGVTSDIRPRVEGTDTEDSWNVFTIDTTNRKLHLSRFGQGEDTVYDY